MIPGALNLPAQTLYQTLPTSGQLLKKYDSCKPR
jgi:hypothetical protein